MKRIDPKRILRNETIHARIQVIDSVVAEYAEAIKRGDEFPPVLLFWDGQSDRYILADGFIRVAAWELVNPNAYIPATIKLGNEETARWAALCANKRHGLRRTNADKRRSVELALKHPKGRLLSNVRIARHVGVSESFVRTVREKLEQALIIEPTAIRKTISGYQIGTLNIGGKKSCGNCDLLRGGRCLYQGDFIENLDQYCPEFRPKREAHDVKIVSLESLELLEDTDKPGNHHTHGNCKGGSVSIPLYKNDPTLSAIELRHRLGDDWLSDLYMAIPDLLKDKLAVMQ